jgi:hypothetical protein
MNNAQLQQLWSKYGDPSVADTMAAIALAESSGNPTDVNMAATEGGAGSWGLWQIASHYHPEFDQQSLLNPDYNAQAAAKVYTERGGGVKGFDAWTQYRNGTYKRYLSGAPSRSSANGATSSSTLTQVVQTSLNPLVLLNSWVTNPNVNVLYKAFALCAVLIVFGTIKQTQTYAGWASLCILFVLLIQQQPKKAA